jgi:hypothetical protein
MIRRDYILRQVEQFVAMLAKIAGLAKNEQWQEASSSVVGEIQRLTGVAGPEVLKLSETELLARLIQGEPTLLVESKAFMLATLLKTSGDLSAGQGRLEESREYYLKGLQLLLDTFGRNEVTERPDFVPTVEAFLTGLRDAPLPLPTGVLLMRHYERIGEFAKAEDVLFGMLDLEPASVELLEFGAAFYRRLLELKDDVLGAGNLPRAEVQTGLDEINRRKTRLRQTVG